MIRLIYLSNYMEQFSFNLLKGIIKYAEETQPWAVTRMPNDYKRTHGIEGVLDYARKLKADAIIGQFEETDNVQLLRDNGIIVIAQDYRKRFGIIPNITADYRYTGRVAADYLRGKGFRSFAFYGYRDTVWSDEREEGFMDYLKEHNYLTSYSSLKEEQIELPWSYNRDKMETWLKSLPHATAILCCDDASATRLMESCMLAGIRIPEDVSVLGVDNDQVLTQLMYPSLSSIDNDVIGAGYDVAAYIADRLSGKETRHRDIIVKTRYVVERQSTDLFPTANPHIIKILRYIEDNLSSNIMVPDLVELVPLSRRLLELKFKAETGCTLKKYIFRKRINRMCAMLVQTDLSISEISYEVGLGDTKNLSRKFSAVFGCSPTEYRINNR